jgi:F-type H+-transporting ATPase subunit alpha
MSSVPVDKVRDCQDSFLESMRNQHQDVLDFLGSGKIDDAATNFIAETMANVTESYKA